MAIWNNTHNESQAKRLALLKKDASPDCFKKRVVRSGKITRFQYRLREHAEALYAFMISDFDHLQMAVYFDELRDEIHANRLVESVTLRKPQTNHA